MSLLVDPFTISRRPEPTVATVRMTLEVVPRERNKVEVFIVLDEDDLGILGYPGDVAYCAETTMDYLLDKSRCHTLDILSADGEWREHHAW